MHRGPICGREMIFVMKEDTVMLKRLSALPILTFILLVAPLQAIAQQQPQPPAPPQDYYWHGPWHHMWPDGYVWPFLWMFPFLILFMIFVCAVIFFLARCLCGHGIIIGGGRRGCGVTQATRRCRYSTSALRAAKSRRTSTRRKGCDPLRWIALGYNSRLEMIAGFRPGVNDKKVNA